jgi:hypothetical protein
MKLAISTTVMALALGVGATAAAAPAPKPPSKAAVLAALRGPAAGKTPAVSHVYASGVAEKFFVLYTTKGKDCYTRKDVPGKPRECSPTTLPNVALVSRAGETLTVDGTLALPTQEAPWDNPGALQWGVVQVKDFDLDGTPELLVVYAYGGQSLPAVGPTRYKHVALVSPKPLRVALRLDLDHLPGASSLDQSRGRFKFAPGKAEVVVTRTISSATAGGSGREEVTETTTHRFVAGAWKAAGTRRGKARVTGGD